MHVVVNNTDGIAKPAVVVLSDNAAVPVSSNATKTFNPPHGGNSNASDMTILNVEDAQHQSAVLHKQDSKLSPSAGNTATPTKSPQAGNSKTSLHGAHAVLFSDAVDISPRPLMVDTPHGSLGGKSPQASFKRTLSSQNSMRHSGEGINGIGPTSNSRSKQQLATTGSFNTHGSMTPADGAQSPATDSATTGMHRSPRATLSKFPSAAKRSPGSHRPTTEQLPDGFMASPCKAVEQHVGAAVGQLHLIKELSLCDGDQSYDTDTAVDEAATNKQTHTEGCPSKSSGDMERVGSMSSNVSDGVTLAYIGLSIGPHKSVSTDEAVLRRHAAVVVHTPAQSPGRESDPDKGVDSDKMSQTSSGLGGDKEPRRNNTGGARVVKFDVNSPREIAAHRQSSGGSIEAWQPHRDKTPGSRAVLDGAKPLTSERKAAKSTKPKFNMKAQKLQLKKGQALCEAPDSGSKVMGPAKASSKLMTKDATPVLCPGRAAAMSSSLSDGDNIQGGLFGPKRRVTFDISDLEYSNAKSGGKADLRPATPHPVRSGHARASFDCVDLPSSGRGRGEHHVTFDADDRGRTIAQISAWAPPRDPTPHPSRPAAAAHEGGSLQKATSLPAGVSGKLTSQKCDMRSCRSSEPHCNKSVAFVEPQGTGGKSQGGNGDDEDHVLVRSNTPFIGRDDRQLSSGLTDEDERSGESHVLQPALATKQQDRGKGAAGNGSHRAVRFSDPETDASSDQHNNHNTARSRQRLATAGFNVPGEHGDRRGWHTSKPRKRAVTFDECDAPHWRSEAHTFVSSSAPACGISSHGSSMAVAGSGRRPCLSASGVAGECHRVHFMDEGVAGQLQSGDGCKYVRKNTPWPSQEGGSESEGSVHCGQSYVRKNTPWSIHADGGSESEGSTSGRSSRFVRKNTPWSGQSDGGNESDTPSSIVRKDTPWSAVSDVGGSESEAESSHSHKFTRRNTPWPEQDGAANRAGAQPSGEQLSHENPGQKTHVGRADQSTNSSSSSRSLLSSVKQSLGAIPHMLSEHVSARQLHATANSTRKLKTSGSNSSRSASKPNSPKGMSWVVLS